MVEVIKTSTLHESVGLAFYVTNALVTATIWLLSTKLSGRICKSLNSWTSPNCNYRACRFIVDTGVTVCTLKVGIVI